MTQLRISEAADLLGVSGDTMRRWVDQGHVSAGKNSSGRLAVDGASLARRLVTATICSPPR